MSTLIRRDDWIVDSLGNAQTGVNVYVCGQPASTNVTPPAPLATIYSDPLGADPITQPLCSDGQGHVEFYAAPGIYTLVYTSPQIQQVVLVDQCIVQANNSTPLWNSDSSTAGTITGEIDGANTSYQLSQAPAVPASLVLMLNGLVVYAYAFSGTTIVLEVAPRRGDTISARYQIQPNT